VGGGRERGGVGGWEVGEREGGWRERGGCEREREIYIGNEGRDRERQR
jgi:hypothetical protein